MTYPGHDTGRAEYELHEEAALLTGIGSRTRSIDGRAGLAMHDWRCYLDYGKVTSGTALRLQANVDRRASLSVGQRASGRRELHIAILPKTALQGR